MHKPVNMIYNDEKFGLSPKDPGSWNAIVGARLVGHHLGDYAQANYATGKPFKDALAHRRLAHGQKSVFINLDLMVAEGIVAESEAMAAFLCPVMNKLSELPKCMEHITGEELPVYTSYGMARDVVLNIALDASRIYSKKT